jgi:hypothetical protein
LKKRNLDWLAVLSGHFILTCGFTFPLILNFGNALPGLLVEDRDQNLWNLWWVDYALTNFQNPFQTDYMYYPEGVSLYFHTLHPLNGIISMPVQWLFGLVPAYNFVVFVSFIFAGLGAYLLIKYILLKSEIKRQTEQTPSFVTRHSSLIVPLSSFAGSIIFAYSPYHIGTLKGLMQLISLQWLPFFGLFLLKATENKTALAQKPPLFNFNIVWAGVFLLLTALTDWYYVLFLLGFTAIYFVWLLGQWLGRWRKKVTGYSNGWISLGQIGLILAVFFLLTSPILIPMLQELNSTKYYLPDPNDTRKFSADLTAFFVPPTTSTFLGGLGSLFPANYVTGNLAAQVYLGYFALLLSATGLLLVKQARFWALVGIAFWLLSLGPGLRVNGEQPGWLMPFGLIENLPVVKITRSPDRFIVITMLAMSVLAGMGLVWLGRRAKQQWLIYSLPLIAGLLLIAEFIQIPYPLSTTPDLSYFKQLGQDKSDYTIVYVPAQGGFFPGSARLLDQTAHQKRIYDGYISREFDHPFQSSTPGFQELVTLKTDFEIFLSEKDPNLPGQRNWYDAFSFYQARYIVLLIPQTEKQKAATNLSKEREIIGQIVGAPPIYQDSYREVYRVPSVAEPKPFAAIGTGWLEPEKTADQQTRYRWASGKATLNLMWEGKQSRQTFLNFKFGTLKDEKSAKVLLDGQIVWEGPATAAQQPLRVPVTLTSGTHRLEFVIDGKAQSPESLGMGKDTRRLLFYLADFSLE